MEWHNQYFNQNSFLYVKDISLNHRYDALQWYESIHTHVDTCILFILTSLTLSKGTTIEVGWKRQFLSSDMMSKRLYMEKLVAKIINAKTLFWWECYFFNSNVRSARDDYYIDFYNITRLVNTLPMYESVECRIPYQKIVMSFPNHVDNILTYIDREDLWVRPFTKFQ